MQIDRSHLNALAAIIQHGSFEAAARQLNVTASAISQRMTRLEDRLGLILVARGQPCRATAAGEQLCRYAESATLLEHDVLKALGVAATDTTWPTVKIAINADSLATWFIPALSRLDGLFVDVMLDNEDYSSDWLRRGDVVASVSALTDVIAGCDDVQLGSLRYRATASPEFVERWFPNGVTPHAIAKAPCLSFNARDRLQSRWAHIHVGNNEPPIGHRLPSAQAFVDAATAGIGWGMNPDMLVKDKLANGQLVELLPASALDVPLVWHTTRILAPSLAPLTAAVAASGREHLIQAGAES